MKQLDYESSNYKHKEEIQIFVNSFNELADKYVQSLENSDVDLKKVTSSIEKKNASIEKLEASLLDLNNKTNELTALKEMSSEEIRSLNAKKDTISYTDSEVQKMELDDINSQISAKKGKISKIDSKIDSTRAKIKSGTDEKKMSEKELANLEKSKLREEEALFRTQSLVSLVQEIKNEMNKRALDIVNAPYPPIDNIEYEKKPKYEYREPETTYKEITEKDLDKPIEVIKTETVEETRRDPKEVVPSFSMMDFDTKELIRENENPFGTFDINEVSEKVDELDNAMNNSPEPKIEEKKSEPKRENSNPILEEKFSSEGIDFSKFDDFAKDKMLSNGDSTIKNMEILKKHNVPLDYTIDQPEIYYDITSQDLDDLLSIITTDDEGNGMGFTIDFTFNILSELSKINVDKLIDVYNNEFMNVNAKSGIIYLLKLTNPNLTEFAKNRRSNIEILRSLGTTNVDEIISRHPEFINMDNPLFVNVLNVFDRNDLVEKLNSDADVVTKIIEYWKNN